MGIIGTIAAVVGVIVAIIALVSSTRNSKGNILKRIDGKEEQIRKIDHELMLRYGMNRKRIGVVITPLDKRKSKLQAEIQKLKRQL